MRLLFVTSERGMRGGERQVKLLAELLRPMGCEVALCAPPGAAILEGERGAFPVPMANELDPRGMLGIRRAAQASRAELIHAFSARAQGLSLFASRPLVVTRAVAFAAGKGLFGSLKYRRTSAFLAVSTAARTRLLEAGAQESRIHVVPPAIRTELISLVRPVARKALGVGDGEVALGAVGALEREKGFSDLIEAVKLMAPRRSCRLFLIGNGSLRERLEEQARGLPVTFLGNRDDLHQLLVGFDLYVQPSLEEGFGVALAEAMAAGVPVVASATGGLLDLVSEEATGFLSPPGDAATLAQTLERALADPGEAARRARQAQARVRELYSPEAMARATLDVYRRVLSR